ncbi:hypothetical protein M8494_10420 [Serratia ureilytica]
MIAGAEPARFPADLRRRPGAIQIAFMMLQPRTAISPPDDSVDRLPGGVEWRTSTPQIGWPMEPAGQAVRILLKVATGLVQTALKFREC